MFIDDTLILGDSIEECSHNVLQTVKLFTDPGFVVHPIVHPSTTIAYLGFVIDSVPMTVTLTPEKKTLIADMCKSPRGIYRHH